MEKILEIWKPQEEDDLYLLPCPFCGSKEIAYMKYEHVAGERWRVMCCGCTAGIDPGYARMRHVVQQKWNKRVYQTEILQ